jgi:hypothetical protein
VSSSRGWSTVAIGIDADTLIANPGRDGAERAGVIPLRATAVRSETATTTQQTYCGEADRMGVGAGIPQDSNDINKLDQSILLKTQAISRL